MSFLSNASELYSALGHAQSHGGGSHSEEDNSLFDTALSMLDDRKEHYGSDPDVDEESLMRAHKKMYRKGGHHHDETHDSSTVGEGAAMQALQMFTSGGDSDGGMDKNMLIGMAMSQAGTLWEEKNAQGSVSGDKQSAINAAAEAALKMYIKGQGGIGGTGGPSGLMGLASKFM